jgi:outer membrane protein insertion porin family
LLPWFCRHAAWALEPFKVQDIRVEGLQRVEPGTVFASMPLRVGDTYNDDKGAAAIRALFALGLFKDVRLEANGDVLVVVVEERPPLPTWTLPAPRSSTRTRSRRPCATWA